MDKLEQFLDELSELSRKYNTGIEGGVLYEYDNDDPHMPDSELQYIVDEQGNLTKEFRS